MPRRYTTGMVSRHVGILLFPNVTALDLIGPAEAFASTLVDGTGGRPRPGYTVHIIGIGNRPCVAESGVKLIPDVSFSDAPALDTLIVPGGHGLREPTTHKRVVDWLREVAPRTRRMASVCTGIYALASTGMLNHCRVTTHWRFAADVARRFPLLRVEPAALYLKEGKFYTSAGVTAGIDLSLALIEEDYGPQAALTVARELAVFMKRPGGQEQYSEPLRFQTRAGD